MADVEPSAMADVEPLAMADVVPSAMADVEPAWGCGRRTAHYGLWATGDGLVAHAFGASRMADSILYCDGMTHDLYGLWPAVNRQASAHGLGEVGLGPRHVHRVVRAGVEQPSVVSKYEVVAPTLGILEPFEWPFSVRACMRVRA